MSKSEARPGGRREFLVQAGLAVGAFAAPAATVANAQEPAHNHADAKPFQFKKEPQRQRKSFYDLTDAEVRLLCRAIGHMRNGTKDTTRTPPIEVDMSVDNPLQWDQWVATHARHCTESGPGVPQVHWSWHFLPWHRAYLWFFERHLANIVTTVLHEDGDRFALPYWDWINHKEIPNTREREKQGKPSPLFGYDLSLESMNESDNLGFDNMALWDGYRAPTLQNPRMDPKNEKSPKSKEEIEATLVFMSQQYIDLMLMTPWDLFMGKPDISRDDGQGVLERYPHNNGHDWVGCRQGKNRDMGTLRYAALDPIFFMHHGNIERIWTLYKNPQPDPDGPYGKQEYTFTDLDKSQVTVTVKDIIRSITNVTYLPPQGPAPAPRMLTSLAIAPQSGPRATPTERNGTFVQKTEVLTAKPLSITISAGPELRPLLTAGADAKTHSVSILEVQTGAIPYAEKFSIRLFVNKPDANRETSMKDPHYVGTISALDGQNRRGETGEDVSHTFPVILGPSDANFYKLVKTGDSITFTMVPVGPPENDQGFRIPIKGIKLRVF
jgi:polyphenol oxidase